MKAIVYEKYGAPDVLELREVDKPAVRDDEVLVRVHAAAVGKGDWLTVRGLPYVARMRYGLPKPKNSARASTWPGVLRRSAGT
jgi:NADPH:quinone reductase-like Zn-dependent oxidoreductase